MLPSCKDSAQVRDWEAKVKRLIEEPGIHFRGVLRRGVMAKSAFMRRSLGHIKLSTAGVGSIAITMVGISED